MAEKTLTERYVEILSDLDESYLLGTALAQLSRPFLVSEPLDPARKVMVIGRECGWNWNVPYKKGDGVQAYVDSALVCHREKFQRWMSKPKSPYSATYFGFMQALGRELGSTDSLIYSNLFCFDYEGGDPRKARTHYAEVVEPYSEKLLRAQIAHFKPQLIIFANGIDSKNVRKKFFPHQEGVVKNVRWSGLLREIPDNQLWEFTLSGTHCLRIHHPSAFSVPARQTREYLLRNLESYLLAIG